MARTTHTDEQRRTADERPPTHERPSTVEETIRRFGAVHVVAGLLGFVGPAVEGNDDRLVNVEPGLFLGVVAVNGPHSLMHVLVGLNALRASRDEESARRHAELSTLLFAALAAVGWRRFGFERGVHRIGPLAVDGWGNFGHTIISALALDTALRSRDRS